MNTNTFKEAYIQISFTLFHEHTFPTDCCTIYLELEFFFTKDLSLSFFFYYRQGTCKSNLKTLQNIYFFFLLW